MKKIMSVAISLIASLGIISSVSACPAWECQLGLDDWSCGGVHGICSSYSSSYSDSYCNETNYNEYTDYSQYVYCPYCGHEMWDCVCGTDYNECQETYQEIYQNYDSSYDSGCYYDSCDSYDSYETYYDSENYIYSDNTYSSCSSSSTMNHWANVRDCYGNIIGQVGCGSSVEVCGIDPSNPDRVLIYDYMTGTYGSVLSECVYGNYQWDGTGDNGYYNQYQGDNGNCYENYQEYNDCSSYSGDSCSYGYYGNDCSGGYTDCSYSGSGYTNYGGGCDYSYLRYTEAVQIVRQWEMATGACHTLC